MGTRRWRIGCWTTSSSTLISLTTSRSEKLSTRTPDFSDIARHLHPLESFQVRGSVGVWSVPVPPPEASARQLMDYSGLVGGCLTSSPNAMRLIGVTELIDRMVTAYATVYHPGQDLLTPDMGRTD